MGQLLTGEIQGGYAPDGDSQWFQNEGDAAAYAAATGQGSIDQLGLAGNGTGFYQTNNQTPLAALGGYVVNNVPAAQDGTPINGNAVYNPYSSGEYIPGNYPSMNVGLTQANIPQQQPAQNTNLNNNSVGTQLAMPQPYSPTPMQFGQMNPIQMSTPNLTGSAQTLSFGNTPQAIAPNRSVPMPSGGGASNPLAGLPTAPGSTGLPPALAQALAQRTAPAQQQVVPGQQQPQITPGQQGGGGQPAPSAPRPAGTPQPNLPPTFAPRYPALQGGVSQNGAPVIGSSRIPRSGPGSPSVLSELSPVSFPGGVASDASGPAAPAAMDGEGNPQPAPQAGNASQTPLRGETQRLEDDEQDRVDRAIQRHKMNHPEDYNDYAEARVDADKAKEDYEQIHQPLRPQNREATIQAVGKILATDAYDKQEIPKHTYAEEVEAHDWAARHPFASKLGFPQPASKVRPLPDRQDFMTQYLGYYENQAKIKLAEAHNEAYDQWKAMEARADKLHKQIEDREDKIADNERDLFKSAVGFDNKITNQERLQKQSDIKNDQWKQTNERLDQLAQSTIDTRQNRIDIAQQQLDLQQQSIDLRSKLFDSIIAKNKGKVNSQAEQFAASNLKTEAANLKAQLFSLGPGHPNSMDTENALARKADPRIEPTPYNRINERLDAIPRQLDSLTARVASKVNATNKTAQQKPSTGGFERGSLLGRPASKLAGLGNP